jgi:hypothetical protein
MALQLGSPVILQVRAALAFSTMVVARDVERRVHSALTDCRLHGEWFEVDVAEAVQYIERCSRVMRGSERSRGRLTQSDLSKLNDRSGTGYRKRHPALEYFERSQVTATGEMDRLMRGRSF